MLPLFEKLGTFLSKPAAIFLLLLCALISSSPLLLSDFKKILSLKEKKERLENLTMKRKDIAAREQEAFALLERAKASDPLYLEKHLISLKLKEEEISALKKERQNPFVKQRLALLQKENRIDFSSQKETAGQWLETEFGLLKPVLASEGDIAKILSAIEGVKIDGFAPPPGRPQLGLKSLMLFKKEGEYELTMKLLKKEPIER